MNKIGPISLKILLILALMAVPAAAQSPVINSGHGSPSLGSVAAGGNLLVSPEEDFPKTAIVVTTIADTMADDGLCSLREAVTAARTNLAGGGCPAGDPVLTDTITFSVAGTITLSESPLQVSGVGWVVIDGAGGITISGDNSVSAFSLDNVAQLTLKNLSIANGYASSGGAIMNPGGVLRLENSIISNSRAYDGISGGGGAIYNQGSLTLLNSALIGNTASVGSGGAIYNEMGTVTIINSTLSGNSAAYGGAVFSKGELLVTNSTLSGNNATFEGGGINNQGSALLLSNATIASNTAGFKGGGVYTENQPLILRNTILAQNTAQNFGPDCLGIAVTSQGYNLIGSTAACGFYPRAGDLTNISPRLGPLQDNGGTTLTHALLAGSLAINHGSPYGCRDHQYNLLTADQRGLPRSGRCDIGAFEYQPQEITGTNKLFIPCLYKGCTSLLFDDFSDPGSGWPVNNTPTGLREYLNGEYRILAKVKPAWEGSLKGFSTSDYVISVDVRNATGIPGYGGILFSFAPDYSYFYFFTVHTDGKFVILRADPETSYWIADGYSPFINTGLTSNRLKLERKGSMIWAYANGELLTILSDGVYTGTGYVGMINVADTNPLVDIRFDNFTIEPISCGLSASHPVLAGTTAEKASTPIAIPVEWEDLRRAFEAGE